jgi:hypothetical protein
VSGAHPDLLADSDQQVRGNREDRSVLDECLDRGETRGDAGFVVEVA